MSSKTAAPETANPRQVPSQTSEEVDGAEREGGSSSLWIVLVFLTAVVLPVCGMVFRGQFGRFLHPDPAKPAVITASPPVVSPKAVPPAVKSTTPILPPKPVQPQVAPGTFTVTSISLAGSTRLAVVNGKSVSEGDHVFVSGQPAWKVAQIGENDVVFEQSGSRVVVPLSANSGLKPLNDRLQSLH